MPASESQSRQGHTWYIDCLQKNQANSMSCVNTISRAELAAIHVAVTEAGPLAIRPDGTMHIATDSLGSIFGIRKAIDRPQDIREHRHLHLLEGIAEAVQASPGVVHIWKVKSHIGIAGNEVADAAAVAVARGETDPSTLYQYNRSSNQRASLYWPYKRVQQQQETEDQTTTRTVYEPLANLEDALKEQAQTHRWFGRSNLQSHYTEQWLRSCDQMDHRYSQLFLNNTTVSMRTKKLAIGCRFDVAPTHKQLHRYGKIKSALWPLRCGEPDNCHHAISACPKLSTTVTCRYNDAGSLILEAVYKSAGANKVLLSDVGIRRRWQDGDIPARLPCNRYLRDTDLSMDMPAALITALQAYTGSIPDIMLQSKDEFSIQNKYVVVEIKYCKDTDPEPQRQRAQEQHSAMIELLERHDPNCTAVVVPIMLGVTGVIYKDTLEAIENYLGVEGTRLATLARRLHFTAVTNMQKIWKQRRAIMMAARKSKATQPDSRTPKRAHEPGEPDHRKKPRLK
jgi:ribonuclease HI